MGKTERKRENITENQVMAPIYQEMEEKMRNHLLYQELKIAMTIALASNVQSWTVLQDHTFHKESVARSAQEDQEGADLPILPEVHLHQVDTTQMILINHLMNYLEKSMLLDQVEIEELEDDLVLQEQWAHPVLLVIQAHLVSLETLDLLDPNPIYSPSLTKFKHLKVDKKDLRLILSLTCKLKLDLWDREDLQVWVVLLDLKVSWVLKEKLEIQA